MKADARPFRDLLEKGARFVALVGVPADAGLRLIWHWDRAGELLTTEITLAAGEPAPSIADVCPAADWAERELRDYYGVTFEGRSATPPLVLRDGDPPGLLRNGGGP